MNEKELARLYALFTERKKWLARLAALKRCDDGTLPVSFYLDGRHETIGLEASYIGAQWTAALLDVERKIRAAGGTI